MGLRTKASLWSRARDEGWMDDDRAQIRCFGVTEAMQAQKAAFSWAFLPGDSGQKRIHQSKRGLCVTHGSTLISDLMNWYRVERLKSLPRFGSGPSIVGFPVAIKARVQYQTYREDRGRPSGS